LWVIVMFDLPTDNARARKEYASFRKALLDDGFMMIQYSVYARHCASEENAVVHAQRVKCALPPDGEVRIFRLTDKQYARVEVYFGRCRKPPEAPPRQLEFF